MHFLCLLITALLISAFIYRHTHTSSSFSSPSPRFQSLFSTACQEFTRLSYTPSALLLTCIRPRISHCYNLPFLALLILSGDIELNPGPSNFCLCTLNIRSILHPLHSAALSDLIVSHHPDLFCLTETWVKSSTTFTELAHCTPPNYTFLSTPRICKGTSSKVVGGGTGFLIREPFTQLSTSTPQFSSFELSSVTLKLPQSKMSFFNIYRPPSSSSFSKPFSLFLDEFNSFLSVAATTPHEFIITGDFNIHLDNPSDHVKTQFLSVLSSFNLTQHVNFPTHSKNHIRDLVITSADSSLTPSLSTSLCSPSDHFPIFTKLSISSTPTACSSTTHLLPPTLY